MAVSQAQLLQEQITSLQQIADKITSALEKQQQMNERVIIMIDRSNLDQTWRRINNGGMRPDYMKIKELLTNNRTLKQIRLYYSDVEETQIQEIDRAAWQARQDFYRFLRHQGWILRYVEKKFHDGYPVEKGLDAALIRDMETICRDGRCDTVVLVAGDADYCEVVREVQDRYCAKVEVAFFPNQTSRTLQLCSSKFINLEENKDKIMRVEARRLVSVTN